MQIECIDYWKCFKKVKIYKILSLNELFEDLMYRNTPNRSTFKKQFSITIVKK